MKMAWYGREPGAEQVADAATIRVCGGRGGARAHPRPKRASQEPGPSSIAITGAVPRESVGQGDRSARCGFFGESDEIYFKGGSSALITALVNAIHRHGAGLCPDDAPKDGKIVLGFDAPGARRLKISMS
jgi:hypothetical protein